MADLSAEKREDIPSKHFGLPEKARTTSAKKESGNYPDVRQEARPQCEGAGRATAEGGNLSREDKERIDRKADKKLDE